MDEDFAEGDLGERLERLQDEMGWKEYPKKTQPVMALVADVMKLVDLAKELEHELAELKKTTK